ncbi:hypothetical protein FGU46_07690 [Methanobacterium sp. CWC-01]|uniref:hypothetical protein n=1 Tax=Methanobacterium aridiramus TaxID=2584467 RepID=UPI00257801C0|nr:hypothetical protein [Methanobacterium sp. CWC-01]WJI09977.1 hypothetical protein FGU46_07690 [Methanobacterium sp. CWC-01]
MKRIHPIIAILLGYFIAGTLAYFLPDIPLSDILSILVLILGGFIATYISRTNKAILGLYEGLVYTIIILSIIFLFNTELTAYLVVYLALPPILGLLGGFLAKKLRLRLETI